MNWIFLIGMSAILHAMWMLLLKRDMKHQARTQLVALYPLIGVIIVALFFPIDYQIIFTRTVWLLFVLALCVCLSVYCGSLALKRLPISIYAPMVNISPIFLLVLGYFLLAESVSIQQLFGLLITLFGAIFLDLGPDHKLHLTTFLKQRAVIVLLLAGVTMSFAPIILRLLLLQTDKFTVLFWFPLFVSVIYWVVHWVKYQKLAVQGVPVREWLWIIATGVVIFASDFTYLSAVAIPGTILVVLVGVRRLSTLFATLFGGKLMHEDHLLYKSAMCMLMIIGTVLLVV